MDSNSNYPHIPFKSVLDLSGLIQFWINSLKTNPVFKQFPADKLLTALGEAEELRGPITDLSILEKNKELLEMLISVIIPPARNNKVLMGIHAPFNFSAFYGTPGYAKILPYDSPRDDIKLYEQLTTKKGAVTMANLFVLNKFYGTNIDYNIPIIIGVPDLETGVERVYRFEIDTQFMSVEAHQEPKKLSKETINLLLDNLNDSEIWMEHIDSENFYFKGFATHTLVDVTEQEMLSSIKYYLLKRDAVTCGTNFLTIQQKIRSLFNIPSLKLGILFFDPENNIISNSGISDWNTFLSTDKSQSMDCSYLTGSMYERAFNQEEPVIVENLNQYPKKTRIEREMLSKNIQNVIISPLVGPKGVLGILELVTDEPGLLNSVNADKIYRLLPMFTAAIGRVLEDLNNEVRAIIQKECTSIHPSVEWKFLEAGYQAIRENTNGDKKVLSEIVFPDVYPLFGMSDIRESSVFRNNAICADLIKNLNEAEKALTTIQTNNKMPILDELFFRIEKELKQIEPGLATGSEASVISFLKNEVNPVINIFRNKSDELKVLVEGYFNQLDPVFGVIYQKRKQFEESLTLVNESISSLIDKAETQAQDIVPHYFEKYKTDGIEYNLYLGQSLLKEQTFDPLYIKNFRIWQLLTMCEIARNIESLQTSLSHPLEIAQLILVHSEPLAIKFRQDEKRFDVDGAYNIRYEIVKKRIDKALIKSTGERLTQPGKISVVYSRDEDAMDYKAYFEFLAARGYIEPKVEQLELEDLQGAKGLHALRISVLFDMDQKEDVSNSLIEEMIASLEEA